MINSMPISYIEPVFRPPSEAHSLILPVTNGCSWNKCTFCEMYTAPQKKFQALKPQQVVDSIKAVAEQNIKVKKIFLADGDAMVLSTRRLAEILSLIKEHLPFVSRVSSYCLPRNVKKKSVEDLKELASLGLELLYVGCETGDDEVLNLVNKGESFASSLKALNKIHQAGIKSSVIILNGLGGLSLSAQHAVNSAKLVNETQPAYLSSLVLSFPLGMNRFNKAFDGSFVMLNQQQLLEEMALFVSKTNLRKTIFRSDHASNYLALKGILGRDKELILQNIFAAIRKDKNIHLREEWQRGL